MTQKRIVVSRAHSPTTPYTVFKAADANILLDTLEALGVDHEKLSKLGDTAYVWAFKAEEGEVALASAHLDQISWAYKQASKDGEPSAQLKAALTLSQSGALRIINGEAARAYKKRWLFGDEG